MSDKDKPGSLIFVFLFFAAWFVVSNIAAIFPSSCDWFLVRMSHAEQCKLNALRELK